MLCSSTQVMPSPGPSERARKATAIFWPATVKVGDQRLMRRNIHLTEVTCGECGPQLGLVEPACVREREHQTQEVQPREYAQRVRHDVRGAIVEDQVQAVGTVIASESKPPAAEMLLGASLEATTLYLLVVYVQRRKAVGGAVTHALELAVPQLARTSRLRQAKSLWSLQIGLLIEAKHGCAPCAPRLDMLVASQYAGGARQELLVDERCPTHVLARRRGWSGSQQSCRCSEVDRAPCPLLNGGASERAAVSATDLKAGQGCRTGHSLEGDASQSEKEPGSDRPGADREPPRLRAFDTIVADAAAQPAPGLSSVRSYRQDRQARTPAARAHGCQSAAAVAAAAAAVSAVACNLIAAADTIPVCCRPWPSCLRAFSGAKVVQATYRIICSKNSATVH